MTVTKSYNPLVKIKKFFFPTKYDKAQRKLYKEQVDFYRQFIKSGDICFDLGANYGSRTSIFLLLGAKVVALEPQQSCYEYLVQKYGKKVVFLQKGAGAQKEVRDFYICDNNSPISTFSKNWIEEFKESRFAGSQWNRTEKIELITLDSLIADYGIPGFIKIDVEGYELEVLKGLSKEFKLLCFEYVVPEKLEAAVDCLLLLKNRYAGLLCNYCVGDFCTAFEMEKWLSIEEMIGYLRGDNFGNTFAGDIYVRKV
jgi:FkbM family methyltransferase